MGRLRFGIVGVGNRGRALGGAALETGEVEIVAYADPHAQSRVEAAKVFKQAPAFESLTAMLASEQLDAVLIATPNAHHVEPILAAFEARLHVLCEKPLALSLDDIDLVVQAGRTAGRIFQVGMELRHAPLFREFQRLASEIGTPKMLWCHEFRPPFKPGVGNWRLSHHSSGGTLLEKNCHHFDLFNWLSSSRPTRVMAMGHNDSIYAERDILDRAWVIVDYASGLQASLGVGMFFEREEHLELGALGTAGKLTCALPEGQLVLDTQGGRTVRRCPTPSGFAHGGEVEQQLAFVHSIRTAQPPRPDADDARWSHAISMAAEAAVRTGQPVHIDATGRPVI